MAYIRFAREEKELFKLLWNGNDACYIIFATSFVDWDKAFISKVLTDTYEGIKRSYTGRKSMEYIRVTKENIEKEHICCAISSNKDIQVISKKNWLKARL